MDALALLKRDHLTLNELFKQVERLGDHEHAQRSRCFERIDEELSMHLAMEERLFYPAYRARAIDTEERNEVLGALEEHAIAMRLLRELRALDPKDETFAPKLRALIAVVRRHAKEDEGLLYAMTREMFERRELEQVGRELDAARNRLLAADASEPTAARRFRRAERGEIDPERAATLR